MSDNLDRALLTLIRPVHQGLMADFGVPASPEAEAFSLAAGFQESKFQARDQGDPAVLGPATGFWQFERNGGVAEILETARTSPIAEDLCRRLGVSPTRDAVWRVFATQAGDELACCFARLLAWKDPAQLPALSPAAEEEAYRYYDRNWRPGLKRRRDWSTSWRVALDTVARNPRTAAPTAPAPAPSSPSLEARVAALEAWVRQLQEALARFP